MRWRRVPRRAKQGLAGTVKVAKPQRFIAANEGLTDLTPGIAVGGAAPIIRRRGNALTRVAPPGATG